MALVTNCFVVPDLECQGDSIVVGEALEECLGVEGFTIDHVGHTVTVTAFNEDGPREAASVLRAVGYPPDEQSTTSSGSLR